MELKKPDQLKKLNKLKHKRVLVTGGAGFIGCSRSKATCFQRSVSSMKCVFSVT
jgi:FlaA1/EpsC-like NDP-sugar epimerase